LVVECYHALHDNVLDHFGYPLLLAINLIDPLHIVLPLVSFEHLPPNLELLVLDELLVLSNQSLSCHHHFNHHLHFLHRLHHQHYSNLTFVIISLHQQRDQKHLVVLEET